MPTLLFTLCLLLALPGCARPADHECFSELFAYDANGAPIPIRAVSAKIHRGHGENLLLPNPILPLRFSAGKLWFPKKFVDPGVALELEFLLPNGRSSRTLFSILDCRQRRTVRVGGNDSGYDVSGTTLSGALRGCPLTADWWIRILPMFGQPSGPDSILDAYIRLPDGRFSVTAPLEGERMLLVAGKGKHPVKAIGVDTVQGIPKDLGVIDLAGACPK